MAGISGEHVHDYVYYGALNIYRNSELVEVVDSWRCRLCHVMRVWKRGPEYVGSTDGMMPDLEQGRRWVLLVCKAGQQPRAEIHQLMDGEVIPHKCVEEIQLTYSRASGLEGVDSPLTKHYAYEMAEIVRGYIELGTNPPEVVTLRK
ncbi:MAG: hypothetical protein QW756_03985 [Nitrososphaerota archaeon]